MTRPPKNKKGLSDHKNTVTVTHTQSHFTWKEFCIGRSGVALAYKEYNNEIKLWLKVRE